MPFKFLNLTNLTLVVALALSTVAAYYSIIGLTAIFAGAVIPVIVMGSILEVGKIVTAVWLRKYWNKAGWILKLYLVPAVVALALLTSMGIFGFLSRAHTEQNVVSGDVVAKLSIYDEKIKISKDNIDANRKALKQLDEAVDQIMGRSTTETGADKAVAVRRSQQKERGRLLNEIEAEQKKITSLNEERAPIAAQVRKVEAEVGPIKYIAALLYGDNPDQNLLEKSVRWVIILLVIVFDPLAIALVLAANQSKEWDKDIEPNYEPDDGPLNDDQLKQMEDSVAMNIAPEHPDVKTRLFTDNEKEILDNYKAPWPFPEEHKEEIEEVKQVYLDQGFGPLAHPPGVKPVGPLVYTAPVEEVKKETTEENITKSIEDVEKNIERKLEIITALSNKNIDEPKEITVNSTNIETEGVTATPPFKDLEDGYVNYQGRVFKKDALKELKPELFILTADHINQIKTNFGTEFPKISNKGDVFVRVDVLPNRVFKFDGKRWIEINKETTDSYLHDRKYIEHLIDKIDKGEYDAELLSENEKYQIEEYLRNQNN